MKMRKALCLVLAVFLTVCQIPFSAAASFDGEEKDALAVCREKAEYIGDEAPAPNIESRDGKTVRLKEITIEGEEIEYGYTKEKRGEPSFWQPEREFELDAGKYFFYTRVKESEEHLAGSTSMESKLVVISEPLQISYPSPVILEGKINIRPTVTGGTKVKEFILEGELPKNLAFQNRMGIIQGNAEPDQLSSSVNITAKDKDGSLSNTFTIEFIGKEEEKDVVIVCPEKVIYGDRGHFIKIENNNGEDSFAVSGDAAKVDSLGNIKINHAGSAEIKVTAFDSKNNKTEKSFVLTVLPKALDISMAADIPDCTYSGMEIKPKAELFDEEAEITHNDYETSYENNLYAGKAFAVIKGKGNYEGSFRKEFKILPDVQEPFVKDSIKVFAGGNTFDLNSLVSDIKGRAPFKFYINGENKGVSVENNILKTGDREGKISLSLEIEAADINKDGEDEISAFLLENAVTAEILKKQEGRMDVLQKDITYNEAVSPEYVKQTGYEYKFLYEGENFKGEKYLSASAPVDAGEYKLTVSAEGPDTVYRGSCDFKIFKKDIASAEVFTKSP